MKLFIQDEEEEKEEEEQDEDFKKNDEKKAEKYYAKSPLTAIIESVLLFLDIFDYISDFIVILELYRIARSPAGEENKGYMAFVIAYSVCEMSPYLISYSSGISLF